VVKKRRRISPPPPESINMTKSKKKELMTTTMHDNGRNLFLNDCNDTSNIGSPDLGRRDVAMIMLSISSGALNGNSPGSKSAPENKQDLGDGTLWQCSELDEVNIKENEIDLQNVDERFPESDYGPALNARDDDNIDNEDFHTAEVKTPKVDDVDVDEGSNDDDTTAS